MQVDVWHDDEIPVGKWVYAAAQMACGCYARCEVLASREGVTAREAVNRFGGFIAATGDEPVTLVARDKVMVIQPEHNQEHRAICRAAYPPPTDGHLWIDDMNTYSDWEGPFDPATTR
jgi:hypothetical protein